MRCRWRHERRGNLFETCLERPAFLKQYRKTYVLGVAQPPKKVQKYNRRARPRGFMANKQNLRFNCVGMVQQEFGFDMIVLANQASIVL